ncbi:hypothetical protein K439DRAFT_1311218, partial [Ramaria rubella]
PMTVAMSSPPHYILLSHSNLTSSSSTVATYPPSILTHPTIQYHFRDDPLLNLPDPHHAHVFVMDYDPASQEQVYVQSLSPQLVITSLKITDAPGAGSVGEDDEPKNMKMYVLETVAHPPSDKGTAGDAPAVISLANFKQRNALLRRALDYPLPSTPSP